MLQSISKPKQSSQQKGEVLTKHLVKTAKAFAPAAISSFFEIHDTENNKPIADLEKVGARGGGFGLKKEFSPKLLLKKQKVQASTVIINGNLHLKQKQPCWWLKHYLENQQKSYAVTR